MSEYGAHFQQEDANRGGYFLGGGVPSERMETDPTDALPLQGLPEQPEPSNLARSDTG